MVETLFCHFFILIFFYIKTFLFNFNFVVHLLVEDWSPVDCYEFEISFPVTLMGWKFTLRLLSPLRITFLQRTDNRWLRWARWGQRPLLSFLRRKKMVSHRLSGAAFKLSIKKGSQIRSSTIRNDLSVHFCTNLTLLRSYFYAMEMVMKTIPPTNTHTTDYHFDVFLRIRKI